MPRIPLTAHECASLLHWEEDAFPAVLRYSWSWHLSKGAKHISSWFIALLKATEPRHFTHIQSQSPQVTGICTRFIYDISV